MEFRYWRAASFIHSGKEWKANTRSRSEMPVWTVSQKFSHLQWRRLFKELWCRPTTTADFWSSLWQVHHTSNLCLLEDKIQDWGMYLFAISYGSYALNQRSGDGWISGWFKIFIINTRYFNGEFWSTLCEDCFSTEQNHPYSHFKRRTSLEEQKAQKEDRYFSGRQIAYLIYEYFRVTGANDSVENYADLFPIGLRNDDIQEFDSKVGRNFIINDKNSTWWHLGRIVQIKSARVWETQDRIGIVWSGESLEENRTWLSQIEDGGKGDGVPKACSKQAAADSRGSRTCVCANT